MNNSVDEVDCMHKRHESNREWAIRSTFLCEHLFTGQFSRARLECLSNCLVNVRCYGCQYPDEVMHQLNLLAGPDLTSLGDRVGARPPPRIKFVPAGSQSQSDAERSSSSEATVTGTQSLLQHSAEATLTKITSSVPGDIVGSSAPSRPGTGSAVSTSSTAAGPAASTIESQTAAFLLRARALLPKLHTVTATVQVVSVKGSEELAQARVSSSNCAETALNPSSSLTSESSQQHENNITPSSCKRETTGTGRKRKLDSFTVKNVLRNFVLLQTLGTELPVSKLNSSAQFNNVACTYDFRNLNDNSVLCQVSLSGTIIAEGAGTSNAASKEAAAAAALEALEEHCPTIAYKSRSFESTPASLTMDKQHVITNSSGSAAQKAIPDSNLGNKLLKKMGWSGSGGLGHADRQGISEPVSLDAVVNREGLGLAATKGSARDLERNLHRLIEDYVKDNKQDDLVFAPEFTKEEREVIHQVSKKFGVQTRSHGKDTERYLIVSRKRTPAQLVDHIRANGGETYKYRLIPPSGSVNSCKRTNFV